MTRIISINGNIGSGKSTIVKKLEEYYKTQPELETVNTKYCFLQEPVDIWNTITDLDGKTMIENFYSNQEKYAFAFQMMAYISRLITTKEALKKNYDIIFTERCVFADRNVFAKMLYDDGKMNKLEFQIYNKWFDEFIEDLPEIEYIYLRTDPQIAFDRIIKRSRVGENISIEYLTKCHLYHESWFNKYNQPNKCIIDCNVDIEENPEIVSEWLKNVDEYIKQYTITFDGASRGNPGPCGAGFIIWNKNIKLYYGSELISINNTTDYAEYYALFIALKKCNELNVKNIIIKCDSELVIKQFNKENKINLIDNVLLPLYNKVESELNNFITYKFIHISCEKNKAADILANNAVSEYIISKAQSEYTNSYSIT